MQKHKFPYNWRLSEAKFTKDKGKVFSCFACGGGSTMGYKLAGFDAAHGALAMTTPGDTTMASLKEVEGIVGGAGARVQR